MKLITGITEQPSQVFGLKLEDGSTVTITIQFKPQQAGWFFQLRWGAFTADNQRLVASPNVLRQFYPSRIAFGLAVVTNDQNDPITQNTFVNGTTEVYLLEGKDLTDIETIFYGAKAVASLPESPSSSGGTTPVLPESWGPAGGDLTGTYPNPKVRGLLGLAIGTISVGQFIVRTPSGFEGGSPVGSGDVVGPASAVNSGVALFDGTTGKLIKDGGPMPTSLPPSGAAAGDLSGTYPNPSLANIITAVGPIGDSTHVPIITVDAKGRLTAVTSVAIAVGTGDVVGPASAVNSGVALFDGTTGKLIKDGGPMPTSLPPTGAAAGDLSGTYPNPSLANIITAVGPIGDSTHVPIITVDSKGRLTAVTSVAIAAGSGNVVGPASAVDNGVALFDGATGKLIKDGGKNLSLDNLTLTGAVAASIVQSDVYRYTLSIAPGGGAFAVNMSSTNTQFFDLSISNLSLSLAGLAAGFQTLLIIRNSSGSAATITYPAWSVTDNRPPTLLPPGRTIQIKLLSLGTTTGAVLASCIYGSVFNVMDFGAVGNGSTDDTSALQAALNAAALARGAMYIPAGVYKISSTLTVTLGSVGNANDGMSIYGDGMQVSVIAQTSDSGVFNLSIFSRSGCITMKDFGCVNRSETSLIGVSAFKVATLGTGRNDSHPNLRMTNVAVESDPGSGKSFTYGFELVNIRMGNFIGLTYVGTVTLGTGVLVAAVPGPEDLKYRKCIDNSFSMCRFSLAHTGVRITDAPESILFDQCLMVGLVYGIHADYNIHLSVLNSHINTTSRTIYGVGGIQDQAVIVGNDLYIEGVDGFAIQGNFSRSVINSNTFVATTSPSGTYAINLTAGSTGVSICGNSFARHQAAYIVIDSGVTYSNVSGNTATKDSTAAATPYVNNGGGTNSFVNNIFEP